MSVTELQARTDADEFAEWCAFQGIDPASEERADLRTAIVASVIAGLFTKKGDPLPVAAEFMALADARPKRKPRQTTAEMRSVLESFVRRNNLMKTVKEAHG